MKKLLFICLLAITFASNSQTSSRIINEKFNDKELHNLAGTGISAGVGYTMNFLTNRPVLSCLAGFLTGTAVGVGKEVIYDRAMSKGTFSYLDMADTAWGSLVGSFVIRIKLDIDKRKNRIPFLFKKETNQTKSDIIKELYVYNK